MDADSEFLPIAELPDVASAFRAAAQLRREGFSAYARAAPTESPSVEVVVSREDYEEALASWKRSTDVDSIQEPTLPDPARAARGLNDRALSFEVVAVLLVFVAPVLFASAAAYFGEDEYWKSPMDSISKSVWRQLLDLGGAGILLYLIHRSGEPVARFGLTHPRWRRDVPIVLVLLGIVAWTAWFFGLSAVPEAGPTSEHGLPPQAAWPITRLDWSVVVLECCFVGFSEELLFRGYLLTRLERLMRSTDGSWLMTSVLFGLAHLYGGWWHVFGAAFLGAAFGLVFCVTRRLWPIAIAHAANNLLAYALSG